MKKLSEKKSSKIELNQIKQQHRHHKVDSSIETFFSCSEQHENILAIVNVMHINFQFWREKCATLYVYSQRRWENEEEFRSGKNGKKVEENEIGEKKAEQRPSYTQKTIKYELQNSFVLKESCRFLCAAALLLFEKHSRWMPMVFRNSMHHFSILLGFRRFFSSRADYLFTSTKPAIRQPIFHFNFSDYNKN